jgi:predicted CXXCH cytochrome family protein
VWLQKKLHKLLPFSIVGLAFIASSNAVLGGNAFLPSIEISKANGDQCVLQSEEIRRKHPDLLKHDRIATLRKGIRQTQDGSSLKGSLKACINCHAIKDENNQYIRTNNRRHFCVSCHKYAAVTIDCFQCHRDIPEEKSANNALQRGTVQRSTVNLTNEDIAVLVPEVNRNDNK